jgi:hypothetical protein
MPIAIGQGLWGVVLPVEKQNLCLNPSFEIGTQNWGTSTSGTIGTTSQYQQFGAWSCSLQPTTATTDGIRGGVGSMGPGDYGVSAYIRGANGVTYNLEIAPFPTGNALGSTTVLANGQWQYMSFQYTEASPGSIARAVVIRKRSSADVTPFYVDGVQVEVGSVTTYFDGDQAGGTWASAPHASTSIRSGQYRGGGSVVALVDLGLSVDQQPGAGVPPIEVSLQSYAVVDGAQFQRQRAAQRSFSLTAKPMVGTSLADFHVRRRGLFDAFKPDLVTPQQPVRFLYYGAQGTQQLDAYYQSGLELGAMDGIAAEDMAVSFVAADPYWHSPTQQGTTLAPLVSLGSVNYIVKRTPQGQWGTMGLTPDTLNGPVFDILAPQNGTVFVGGNFTTAAGTSSTGFALYNTAANAWGSPTGGILGGTINNVTVSSLAMNAGGSVFVGFNGTLAGGTVARYVAFWAGAWGTLRGGTIAGAVAFSNVFDLAFNQKGSLFVGGDFLTVSGTTTPRVAFWNGAAWGSLTNGTVNNTFVSALQFDPTGKLYAVGDFVEAGGTTTSAIASWNGTWGTLGLGLQNGGAGVSAQALARGPDGRMYAGGLFGTAGGQRAVGIAAWNGVGFQPLGNGVQQTGITAGQVSDILVRTDNTVLIGGTFGTVGSVTVPNSIAQWTGGAWVPMGILLPGGNAHITALAQSLDTSLYIGGNFAGIGSAASTGTVVNNGRAFSYPTLRLRNLGAGASRIYQAINTTTGAAIYFNLTMQPGDQAVLETAPGNRSFQSDFLGNIFGAIIPGSNLATFGLAPGINTLSFLADSVGIEVSLYWTPKGWAADSGTVF